MVSGARAVGSSLLADHEEQVDAFLAVACELISRDEHGSGDSLGIARAAAGELIAVEGRANEGRDGVDVGGESDPVAGARGPNVSTPLGDLLNGHVPPASHEPSCDKIDSASFVAGGRFDRHEFGGESNDVGHGATN